MRKTALRRTNEKEIDDEDVVMKNEGESTQL